MLAQSAGRAGLRVLTADLYADEDTRVYAERCLTIPLKEHGLDEDAAMTAAYELAPPDGEGGLVYGSGIDTRPELLERLMEGRILFGNPPATLRLLKAPRRFFAMLDELAIPYPQSRFIPPASAAGWLIKSGCSEGGKGVRSCAKICPADTDDYYQRRIDGEALSALFLADGKKARIIGFNTQWAARHDPARPFLFAGAVNRAELSDDQRALVQEYVGKLTWATGLLGLNSLDFMLDGETCRVLELNPRPSATMALHDPDYPDGLLMQHLSACRGELPAAEASQRAVRAFRIVYTSREVVISKPVAWPRWCADRPCAGTAVRAGEPLCSVQAEGADLAAVEDLLQARETQIRACLGLRQANEPVAGRQ
jgi:predicted ATP-grasp superfamily ATP-dependent carboligase